MADPVYVQVSSGTIYLMDIPVAAAARERFDAEVAAGRYVVIPDNRVSESVNKYKGTVYTLKAGTAAKADAKPEKATKPDPVKATDEG